MRYKVRSRTAPGIILITKEDSREEIVRVFGEENIISSHITPCSFGDCAEEGVNPVNWIDNSGPSWAHSSGTNWFCEKHKK